MQAFVPWKQSYSLFHSLIEPLLSLYMVTNLNHNKELTSAHKNKEIDSYGLNLVWHLTLTVTAVPTDRNKKG